MKVNNIVFLDASSMFLTTLEIFIWISFFETFVAICFFIFFIRFKSKINFYYVFDDKFFESVWKSFEYFTSQIEIYYNSSNFFWRIFFSRRLITLLVIFLFLCTYFSWLLYGAFIMSLGDLHKENCDIIQNILKHKNQVIIK